jgi:hypothetical protein
MISAMGRLACFRMRSRLEPYADAALPAGSARRLEAHLSGCAACRAQVQEAQRLRGLLQASAADVPAPDWSVFWSGVSARIARERPAPVRDPWWLPLWRPVWGHPRLALSGAVAAGLALTLSLWPVDDDGGLSSAWAAPVVVQDVSAPDPDQSVMVYSSPDRALTVIWLFTPDGTPVAEVPPR